MTDQDARADQAIKLRYNPLTMSGNQVTLAGHDITNFVQAVVMHVKAGDMPEVDLHLAITEIDADLAKLTLTGELPEAFRAIGWLAPDAALASSRRIVELEGQLQAATDATAREIDEHGRLLDQLLEHASGAYEDDSIPPERAAVDYVRWLEGRGADMEKLAREVLDSYTKGQDGFRGRVGQVQIERWRELLEQP